MKTKKETLFKIINMELMNNAIPICKSDIKRQISMNVVVRRYATKGFSNTYGLEVKEKLTCPVIEFYYIQENLKRPLLNETHVIALNIASAHELTMIKEYSYDVFDILTRIFKEKGCILAALKMIFIRDEDNVSVRIQEIKSEDCLLWKYENSINV